MICFRDKSYCRDAEQCANKTMCSKWFSPSESAAAERWWGKPGAPISIMPMRDKCDKWEEAK